MATAAAGGAVLLFALGAWLRLDQIGIQTLIDDEWHAVHQVVRSTPSRILLSMGSDDHSIPLTLYDWLLAQTVGLGELGMRLPMLAAGIASLVLFPWALRGRVDDRARLVFLALLALSPLLATFSRTARPYALTLLLVWAAYALLARATRAGGLRARPAAGYALLSALAVWMHAITAPFVVAPLAALGWRRLRGQGVAWRPWLLLAAGTGVLLALALLPPLLADPAALADKAGRDGLRLATLRGVWHVWFGTASVPVAVAGVALAAWGLAPALRALPEARWALLGAAFTTLAVLVVRPAWVYNPLTFGRYLLPLLPLLLLAAALGLVRLADGIGRRLGGASPGLPAALPFVLLAAAVALWWPRSPWPELLRRPNPDTLHYLVQFDYRPRHNPVIGAFAAIPASRFWSDLAARPPGSVTVAVAPFRFESYDWLAPVWARASGQRVLPGFLSGGCVPWLRGEVPPEPRFALRNAVHLADAAALAARRVDYVAFDRRVKVVDDQGHRAAPECEAWMHQRFGKPVFEDTQFSVWALGAKAPAAGEGPR